MGVFPLSPRCVKGRKEEPPEGRACRFPDTGKERASKSSRQTCLCLLALETTNENP